MAKLMLVEDDNNLREIYQARLQAEGYTIVSAKDGEEALVMAKAEKPDLIIADIMMPKISGFEMLDILRNTEGLKEVKVIMLTALGQNDDQQRANQLGADRYLVKSQVTLEDIVKAAHELIGDQPAPAASAKPAAAIPVTTIPVTATPSEPAKPASSADATAETGKLAQSAAQEEADADSRIEDFVAGATEEATPPATPVQTPATAAADDDKLVTDAAQKLVDSTEDTGEGDKPSTLDEPSPDEADAGNYDNAKPVDSENTKTTHSEKVIKPLGSKPKQDLETLLAVEEAKEAGANPTPSSTPIVVTDDSAGQATPPAQNQNTVIQPSSDEVDPQSSNNTPDHSKITL